MKFIIGNKVKITGATTDFKEEVQERLTSRNPWLEVKKKGVLISTPGNR